jgi:hypothetical protein
MQCEPLRNHYLNAQMLEYACTYNQIDKDDLFQDTGWGNSISQESLGVFLEHLQKDQAKFAQFIGYTLRGVLRDDLSPVDWAIRDRGYFSDFQRDLRALGFEVKVDGLDASVTPVGVARLDLERTAVLDQMLADLSPKLTEMRKGAWESLLSRSADSERHAAMSSRELLDETIRAIVPGRGSRKEKVEKILGETDGQVVEAVANLVHAVYQLQSKTGKQEPGFERALYVINLTEHTLYYLLSSRK